MNIIFTWPSVLQGEVLIFKFVAIDGFASSAIVVGKVSSLAHEVGDDSVESAVFEAKAFLSSAQSSEVLSCLGYYITSQLEEKDMRFKTYFISVQFNTFYSNHRAVNFS